MKNIMLINRTLSSGGAEKVMANLSIELCKKYNVYIALFDGQKIDYDYSGKLIDLKSSLKKCILCKLFGNIKRVIKLRKLKTDLNITHSISFLDTPNLVNVLSRKNDKIIVSLRNFKAGYSALQYLMYKYIFKKADKIVSVSRIIELDIVDKFNLMIDKVITIYNPYNISDIKSKLGNTRVHNNKQLIHVGSFTHQKNHIKLLKILLKIKVIVPDIKLNLLGTGYLEKEIIEFISDNDLKNNVKLHGFVNNPYKYLAKSDLFLFPSHYEGFPNALVEAMICGIPVVSSDCKSGPREILAPESLITSKTDKPEFAEYGVLLPIPIEETSIEMWTKTILYILNNEDLLQKYSRISEKRVEDFELKKIANKWIELINVI
jgi:glycosyltransferase involved in cell wall biosynthesis